MNGLGFGPSPTDLGFTRDRQLTRPKSATADLGGRTRVPGMTMRGRRLTPEPRNQRFIKRIFAREDVFRRGDHHRFRAFLAQEDRKLVHALRRAEQRQHAGRCRSAEGSLGAETAFRFRDKLGVGFVVNFTLARTIVFRNV